MDPDHGRKPLYMLSPKAAPSFVYGGVDCFVIVNDFCSPSISADW